MERLLSTAEVAKALGITPRQVARRVRSGALEAAQKVPGQHGAYLFDPSVVEAQRSTEAS